MKKLVSLLLVVCMALSVGVMLTACGNQEHTHTYKTEWSKDTTHHWHDCEGEDCTDVTDKAEHTWNDGEITTEATPEADGVKTFTCTVCGQTKNEPVEYTIKTTVTKEEWDKALQATEKGLFRYTMTMGERSGVVIFGENAIQSTKPVGVSEYYVKDDDGIFFYTYDEEIDAFEKCVVTDSWEKTVSDYVEFVLYDAGFGDFEFELFSYDEEAQAYICKKIEYPESTDYIFDACFKFSNGKITEATWAFNDTNGTEMVWYNSISYAANDIVVTIPDFNTNPTKATVTEEEWKTAFGFDVDVFQVIEDYSDGSYGELYAYNDTTRVVANDGTDRFAVIYLKETNEGYEQYYTEVSNLSDVDTASNFTKTSVTKNTFVSYFKTTLSQFMDHYDKFEYDEEQRCYVASAVSDDILSANVYFANGRITKLQYTDNYHYSTEYEISYGNIELTLPSVE